MLKPIKRSPALAAIAKADAERLRKALDAGSSPDEANEVGYTLLMAAAATGKLDLVRLLIARGANASAQCSKEVSSARGMSALIMSVRNGFDAVARTLVEAGADVNVGSTWGETPLYEATCRGNDSLVRFLIKHGAKPTLPVPFVAIKNGYPLIFKLLLEAGADVEWRESKTKQTLLGEAVDRGNDVAFVEPLLKKGAKPNVHSGLRYPLNYAALNGNLPVCKLLIKYGAKIDAQDGVKHTALMDAAWRGQMTVVRFLLASNANPKLRDKWGKSAYELALEKNHKEVAMLLSTSVRGE